MARNIFLSVIIPARNEARVIKTHLKQLIKVLKKAGTSYELIVVDDYSDDATALEAASAAHSHITVLNKQGPIGRGYAIEEGINASVGDYIAIVDADMGYDPQALLAMLSEASEGRIIVGERRLTAPDPIFRRMLGKVFRSLAGRLLFGGSHDALSGMFVFPKSLWEAVRPNPSMWSYGLDLQYLSRQAGYELVSVPVPYTPRNQKSFLSLLGGVVEVSLLAFRFLFSSSRALSLKTADVTHSKVGYKKRQFVTHSTLSTDDAAVRTFTRTQVLLLLGLFGLISWGLFYHLTTALIILIGILTIFYFSDLLYYARLIYHSLKDSPEISIASDDVLTRKQWPTYSILCPLYKEWQVLGQFVDGISAMDYPKDKLSVLLLLEEDDVETVSKVKEMSLPDYFHVMVVPDSQPKTKPKACNYALSQIHSEYAVIYDAEDIPDPDQLKKAVLAFETEQDPQLVCLQAKLRFYNASQNLLTRLFALEYLLWFDLVLPGLHAVGAPIPLGGTSNHFRTHHLKLLHGWDPFNVTEDCDLGMRLFKYGYTTKILDSSTYEEANSQLLNWIRQRSRWLKGYMQTYLVHMRRPQEFLTDWQIPNLLSFQLIVGGRVLSTLINPLLWVMTIAYFGFREQTGAFIEALFPPIIFYIALFSLVIGNFIYFYCYMLAAAKREEWWLVKYAYLVPLYWLFMSVAAWKALYQILVKPHYWEKTIHGLHLTPQQSGTLSTTPLAPAT